MKDERMQKWDRAVSDYLMAAPDTPESAAALERVKEIDAICRMAGLVNAPRQN